MTNIHTANQLLLSFLGLASEDNITRLTLEATPDFPPVLTLTKVLNHWTMEHVAQQFQLVPIDVYEPPPLDIQAMADAARERLAAFIQAKTDEAHAFVHYQFALARGQRPRRLYAPGDVRGIK